MKVVIDHLRGSRRGQRQEFLRMERLTIGRHPRSDVSFDAQRDLDSSSRHAELRRRGDVYVLCDIGSSNGTFVASERVGEVELVPGQAVEVEFGIGGPKVRVWTGAVDQAPELARGRARLSALHLVGVVLLVVAVAVACILVIRR